ncbi:unnamed protein product [Didymodactylos carnosus]|uniref:Uncharacterized protein n=1 Tax=Didymodactylos carnosus TaxID=1234261 RepID=A0A8S2E8W7_9BILA|nr:unnamed protein product [Didymodactylos carnosus]CAF3896773.1 unnamed protein product [Didymodactylos carnosus]
MLQINKKSKIQETIRAARQARIQAQAAEAKIDLKELDRVTSSIIESCTKDNITSGKNFIFTHNQTSLQTDTICLYLVDRLLSPDASFDARLHLIYLINDILHNCVRKGYDELRLHLEKIIVPTFCLAVDQADEERKGKLVKLLDLWEKNKYFRVEIMEKLRDINQARIHYEEAIKIEYAPIIDPIEANFEGKYHQLERQHQDFIQHTQTQLVQISHMQQSHQQQQQFASSLPPHIPQTPQLPPNMFPPPPNMVGPNGAQQFGPQQGNNIRGPPLNNRMLSPSIPSTSLQPPPLMSLNPFNDNGRDSLPPQTSSNVMNPQGPCLPPMPNPNLISQQMFEQVPSLMSINTYQPPSSNDSNDEYSSNENSQDGSLSNNVSSQISELTPEVPYYDLPAGLMCPLVKDDDCDYRSLDPHLIRLPPPQVPTERLLAAIDNFYSAATHDSPRNAEGWERLGLFEFYKMKNKYKYSKERIQRIAKEQQDALKPPGRQRKSVSSTSSSSSSRSTSSDLSDDQGQKRRRSRSRSESPRAHHHHQTHSIVTLPRPKSRSKTKSRSRSVSPPTFTSAPVGIGTINPKAQHHHTTQKLDESNIGHKLLQKMGWKGKGGLGLKGQGIAEPIAAGAEVRERNELYKGIGVEEDPFEQFRKNKSKGYVNRLISARATTTTKRKPKDGEEDDEDEDEQQQQQEGSGDIFATT